MLLLSGCCWLRGVLLRLGLVGDSSTTRCLAAFIHLLWRLRACRGDSAQLASSSSSSRGITAPWASLMARCDSPLMSHTAWKSTGCPYRYQQLAVGKDPRALESERKQQCERRIL